MRVGRGSPQPSARPLLAFLKWFIIACALFIACSNLLYFGFGRDGFRIFAPRDSNTMQIQVDANPNPMTRWELAAAGRRTKAHEKEPAWSALLSQVASEQAAHASAHAAELSGDAEVAVGGALKAALLCLDAGPFCGGDMLRENLCRPAGLSLDVPLWKCKRSCGVCEGLSHTLSDELELEVEVVHDVKVWADSCRDVHDTVQCEVWAQQGLCSSKPRRMLGGCRTTCGFCATAPNPATIPDPTVAGAGGGTGRLACFDSLSLCPYLQQQELCTSESDWWMRALCPASCGGCVMEGAPPPPVRLLADLTTLRPTQDCQDYSTMCAVWQRQGECLGNAIHMSNVCARTCSLCQARPQQYPPPGAAIEGPVLLGIDNNQALRRTVYLLPPPMLCADERTDSCAEWAKSGECKRNPLFMHTACQKSCGTCGEQGRRLKQPMQEVLLNNGVLMPVIGFGTAGLGEGTQAAVAEALRAGYRHVDSAEAYEWYRESAVGAAVKESGIPRNELFITTKVHPKNLGRSATTTAVQQSLTDLGVTYIDLVLLHYPRCWEGLAGCSGEAKGTWQESYSTLEELLSQKLVRAIGVSNFELAELTELLRVAKVRPQVVQVHVDPLAQASELVEFCVTNGIQVEAYSSLGTQWVSAQAANGVRPIPNPVLTHTTVAALAAKHERSAAQVVLRWGLQRGLVVLPRSSNAGRQRENLDLFSFSLPEEDMVAMGKVPVT